MPCPISGFLPMMVTRPSGLILMNEFGVSGVVAKIDGVTLHYQDAAQEL